MPILPTTFDCPWLPLFDKLDDGVAVLIPDPWRVAYANSAFAMQLGRNRDELVEHPIKDVFQRGSTADLHELLEGVRSGKLPPSGLPLLLIPPSGAMTPVELRVHRLVVADKVLLGIVISRVAGESTVPAVNVLRRDPLTGLADRSVLLERIATLLGGDRAADRQFAVLFIDLDNFKQVNDAHGHLVGDRVLREVAHRLAGCVREADQIVRFGGDEFVALIERVSGSNEIQPVIERIHMALATPIALPDGESTLSVSVGVAEATADHQTPEDVLGDADRAMYARKRAPR